MKKTKTQKGITLIALIITIVILLILAVVTINAIQGDGIIRYAQNAADDYTAKANEEQEKLNTLLGQIEGSLNEEVEVDKGIVHNGIIPEGGVYYSGAAVCEECQGYNGCICGNNEAVYTVYRAGQEFPELKNGDKYTYGDFEYCYNGGTFADYYWYEATEYKGWGVRTWDDLTSYSEILTTINNGNVTSLADTFYNCVSLVDDGIPTFPSTVTSMNGTFSSCYALKDLSGFKIPNGVTDLNYAFILCTSLEKAPIIPNKVKGMVQTFQGCKLLKDSITINSTPSRYENCLDGTQITEILGDCPDEIKVAILATK